MPEDEYAQLVEDIKEMYFADRERIMAALPKPNPIERAKRIKNSPATKRAGELQAEKAGLQGFIDYQNLLFRLGQPIIPSETGT